MESERRFSLFRIAGRRRYQRLSAMGLSLQLAQRIWAEELKDPQVVLRALPKTIPDRD